ncbi:MAG TPA: hypothetical protein VIO64_18835 [Pseudobacteroides sp.]|uniref:tetratricopeptide repeat protein n=1 Tax=Pseudobacteroides sp. TaxID=1968840 RepID=UPI002F9596E2
MIIPIKLAGIAIACKTAQAYSYKRKNYFKGSPDKSIEYKKTYKPVNHYQRPGPSILSVVSQAISSKIKGSPQEDYLEVVKNTIPQDARILAPTYRGKSKAYELWDIDSDKENELIASYILNDEITTMIIKKQNGLWNIATEIKNPECKSLNFRTLANVTGKGKQLLLGYVDKDNNKELSAYNLKNYDANMLFSHRYNKFSLLKLPDNSKGYSKNHLLFWNRNQRGSYDVEVKVWNGNCLEAAKKHKDAMLGGVLPLYAKRLRTNPKNPDNWYELAVALENAGFNKEALYIIKAARMQKLSREKSEDFDSLENSIRHI